MKLRNTIILINDLTLLFFSLYLSYFIRIDRFIDFFEIKFTLIVSSIIYLIIFFRLKIFNQFFRYFNQSSYNLYIRFYIYFLIIFSFYVFFQNISFIPRSIAFIFPTVFFIFIFISRMFVSKFYKKRFTYNKKYNAVLIGFNPSNFSSIFEYTNVICFVDDHIENRHRSVNGVKIYTSKDFLNNLNNLNFEIILIENKKYFESIKNDIREYILKNHILVQCIKFSNNQIITSPYFDFNFFFNRKNKISELGDSYDNKTILVTGAGGSVGSNIVFQLLKTKFKKLILIDNSEYNLFKLSQQFNSNDHISMNLLDFSDFEKISFLIKSNNVQYIFHAAAYKHVPIIEHNCFSAIKNNFINTYNFINLSIKLNISCFCLISSDKAVRPTNIMGSSKRLAELALLYFSEIKNVSNTKLCSVRFGNVINSSGSVMPLFAKQINNNLPVTITHKDIIRYFMTIEEAANLVLNVIKISKGGEIFLLDMDKPIKLVQLAELMIQFAGKKLKSQDLINGIEIKFIGLRPGEKLFEELLVDNKSKPTSIRNIYQTDELLMPPLEFEKLYDRIIKSYRNNNFIELKEILKNKYINYNEN